MKAGETFVLQYISFLKLYLGWGWGARISDEMKDLIRFFNTAASPAQHRRKVDTSDQEVDGDILAEFSRWNLQTICTEVRNNLASVLSSSPVPCNSRLSRYPTGLQNEGPFRLGAGSYDLQLSE